MTGAKGRALQTEDAHGDREVWRMIQIVGNGRGTVEEG